MKKVILVLLVAALTGICVFTFFGCNFAAGEYTFKSASVGAVTYSPENISSENVGLTLNRDGTYTFKFNYSFISLSESGTWSKNGSTITFTTGDVSTTATYESGELTWANGVYTFVFSK